MSHTPVPIDDLYLYSMHLLDADEGASIMQLLRESPEARGALSEIHGDLVNLALSVDPQPVSDTARQRFLTAIASEHFVAAKQVEHPAGVTHGVLVSSASEAATPGGASQPARLGKIYETTPTTSLFARFLPWAGWAVAAGLAVSTWTLHQHSTAMQTQIAEAQDGAARAAATSDRAVAESARAKTVLETLGSRTAQRFLLTRQNTAPAPSARVTYVASTGSLVFQGNNLDAVPAEKTYELWLIPADKTAKPIPAGTFKPDARGFASLILPDLPKGITAATFGITMEDTGGSQAPTLPILLIGA